jgi:predicted Zn-ribbon and HTH transcriptional regulator
MHENALSETKTVKTKRKTGLSLPLKLVFFHGKYPNGSIQTEQLQGRDCICYKAVIIPDVKTPARFFTGHCLAGLNSLYSVHEPAVLKKAENSAVDRAFHFMGIDLTDVECCLIGEQSKREDGQKGDLKIKRPAVCRECGRVWETDRNGNGKILAVCPECKIKKKLFSKIKVV